MYVFRVVAIVVTFNPDETRLEMLLDSVVNMVEKVLIVDNHSSNIGLVENLIKKYDENVNVKRLDHNYGIGRALNVGVSLALDADLILTLDQDSSVLCDINQICQAFYDEKVGAVWLSHKNYKSRQPYSKSKWALNSGLITRSELFKRGLKYREDFFMDQVDIDFCWQIRSLGYTILKTNTRCLNHRVGLKDKGVVEPSWRLYLVARNSTILLLENKLGFLDYIKQIVMLWGSRIYTSGLGWFPLMALILGVYHGLGKKKVDMQLIKVLNDIV